MNAPIDLTRDPVAGHENRPAEDLSGILAACWLDFDLPEIEEKRWTRFLREFEARAARCLRKRARAKREVVADGE